MRRPPGGASGRDTSRFIRSVRSVAARLPRSWTTSFQSTRAGLLSTKVISRHYAHRATTESQAVKVEDKRGKLDRVVDEWLDGLTCLDGSKGTYIRVLRSWNRWLIVNKHYNAMGATRVDCVAYRSWLINSKRSPHTICSYLSILRMFYKFLYLRGDKADITSGIRGVKRQRYYNKRPLTDAQVSILLGSIDLSTAIGRRDRLILALMVRAGLRSCEVSRLDVGDLTTIAGTASLKLQRKGHTAKDLTIPIADDVMCAIDDYLSTRKALHSEPMIISYGPHGREPRRIHPNDIERIVTGRMADCGITGDGISSHSLRHTFGCMLVDAGVPMDQVQMLMGHNSIDATMVYVKMAADRKLYVTNPANLIKI